jgi:ABC-type glycerol-3-phosphate transport system substrate-binding protein
MNKARCAIAFGLAFISLLGVTACGGDDEGAADSTGKAKISGTLTVWDPSYAEFALIKKGIDRLNAEFEQRYPDVKLDYVPQSFANYDQLLQAAFTGRKTPDVMQLTPGPQGVLRWTKGLDTLNERISDEQLDAVSDWRSATDGLADEGDIYGIPVGVDAIVFYYNKKLFAKAGLPTDFQPQTWEEVKAAGEKLEAAGIQAFTGGNKEGYENLWWFSVAWETINTPEEALALGKGEVPFTDPMVADALAPHLMMQEAGLFEDDRFSTPSFGEGLLRFGEGKAGMSMGFTEVIASYVDYIPKLGEKNIGVFFPPGADYHGVVPFWVWSIPTAAEDKDAAWAYIEFMTSAESIETLYETAGMLPNRSDVETAADAPVQERQILEELDSSEAFPQVHQVFPGDVSYGPFLTDLNEALQGRKSVEEAQQAMQDTFEKAANPLTD